MSEVDLLLCSSPCGSLDDCSGIAPSGRKSTLLRRQGIFVQKRTKKKSSQRACSEEDGQRISCQVGQGDADGSERSFLKQKDWEKSIPSKLVAEKEEDPAHLGVCCGKVVHENLWMTECKAYEENKGPILRIRSQGVETKLTAKEYFLLGPPNKERIIGEEIRENVLEEGGKRLTASHVLKLFPHVSQAFVEQEMEPFSITTNCKQTKWMRLENVGTTAITFQFIRNPPNQHTEKLLRHPSTNPPICFDNDSSLKTRKLIVFWKDTDTQFHFNEARTIILPGQTLRIPIIFRSKKEGMYYENIYLLTHPRLTDEDDKIYRLRISGICMDNLPECDVELEAKAEEGRSCGISVGHVREAFNRQVGKFQAGEILSSIVSSFMSKSGETTSQEWGQTPTGEEIFYRYNPDLHYRYNVAEAALENVRELVRRLLPPELVLHNPGICPLSIRKLYYGLLENPPVSEKAWEAFKSGESESLLGQLSDLTKILKKARHFHYPSKTEKIYSASYAIVTGMINGILGKVEQIRDEGLTDGMVKLLRSEVGRKLMEERLEEMRGKIRGEGKGGAMMVGAGYDVNNEGEEGGEVREQDAVRSTMEPDSESENQPVNEVREAGSENPSQVERASRMGIYEEDNGEDGVEYERLEGIRISEEEMDEKCKELQLLRLAERRRLMIERMVGELGEEIGNAVDAINDSVDYRRCSNFEKYRISCREN